MADGYWNRQQPYPSSRMLKRPRTDYERLLNPGLVKSSLTEWVLEEQEARLSPASKGHLSWCQRRYMKGLPYFLAVS